MAIKQADADDLLAQLLVDGIMIKLKDIQGSRVKVAIEAPLELQILRSELEEN